MSSRISGSHLQQAWRCQYVHDNGHVWAQPKHVLSVQCVPRACGVDLTCWLVCHLDCTSYTYTYAVLTVDSRVLGAVPWQQLPVGASESDRRVTFMQVCVRVWC